jgi:serine/threonine protein kinase
VKKFIPVNEKKCKSRLDYKEMYDREKHYLTILSKNERISRHIPKLYLADDKETFIVMEYKGVDGIDLINSRLLNKEVWKRLVCQMTMVMNEIVSMGYAHRDIKPENVVYDESTMTWALIDFTFMEPSYSVIAEMDFKGTYPYCAPVLGNGLMMKTFLEHNHEKDLKASCDYYSFAVTVFSLIGNDHKTNDIGEIELDLEPIYKVLVDDKSDPLLRELARIIAGFVNTTCGVVTWRFKKKGVAVCTFHKSITNSFDVQPFVERNISKCWEMYMTIFEKQNVNTNVDDNDQVENKHSESN